MGLHFHAVAPLETSQHGVEMLLVDAPQPDLVIGLVMFDQEPTVLLQQALERAGELHVVLPVGRLDRDRAVPCRELDIDRRRKLARAKPLASFHRVDLRNSHHITVASFGDLLRLLALDLEQRSYACVASILRLEVGAFPNLPAERAPMRGARSTREGP